MPHEKEHYITIDRPYGPEELKEKGSRFISYLYPAHTTEEAEEIIGTLRKKYYDSTHVCFAYRLGEGKENKIRFSDDGEPGGTAGQPIFHEIKGKDFYNVVAAVVRYYGGTKLGTGGLVRAYSSSARKVIDTVQPITITLKIEMLLDYPFELTGEIMQIVNRFSLEIVDRQYSEKGAIFKIAVPIAQVEELSQTVSSMSFGKLELKTSRQ
jgi:uncharacterized YigZ family protein